LVDLKDKTFLLHHANTSGIITYLSLSSLNAYPFLKRMMLLNLLQSPEAPAVRERQ